MATLTKINISGEKVGEIEISDQLVTAPYLPQLAHSVAVAIKNAQRGGNASTKTKGEVKATGSKPWRQKGTGRARAGYRSSPIWRGGGVAFGPKPRSYNNKVNKNDKKVVFLGVLAEKIRDDKVSVIENWNIETHKTKIFASLKQKLDSRKLLCIGDAQDSNARLSAGNVADLVFVDAGSLNIINLMTCSDVIISEMALRTLETRYEEITKK